MCSSDLVKSGNARILAVSTAARASSLPETPTLAESGLTGFDVAGWVGMVGPRGLPDAVVQRLGSEVEAVLRDPSVAERIRALGNEPAPTKSDAVRTRLTSDIAKWTSVIATANIERI